MSDIQTKVILEVDNSKLQSGMQKGINQAVNSNQGTVAKGGNVLGDTMGKAFSAIFGAITTKALFDFANQSVQAYRQANIAQATLTGSVQAYANRQQRAKEIVNDSTKSLEQKAMAIGFNVDEIYKEEKASASLNTASQTLQRNIQLQERAFEDSTRAVEQSIFIKQREADQINKQINLLKKETDERVKLRRQQLGGDVLDSELQQLKTQKDILDVQKAEAELAGDPILALTVDNQIKQLNKEINLREQKLDVIDNETQKIKDQAKTQEQVLQSQAEALKTQVDQLRFELSSAQNKFEIDILPAKRQLEDLQATAQSVGSSVSKVVSEDFQKALSDFNAKPDVDAGTLSADIAAQVDRIYEDVGKKVGVGRDVLLKGAAKLAQGGLAGDAQLLGQTLEGFIKIGSQGSLPLSDAVDQLTFQFQSNLAALGETAGLQDEYISQIGPRGLAILQAEGELRGKTYDQLTDEEKARAKAIGLIQNQEAAQAVFNARLEENGFQADANRNRIRELQIALGEELTPTMDTINTAFGDFLQFVIDITDKTPGLASGLFGIATAATLLATGLLVLGGPATLAIAGIGLVIASVADAWNNNTGGIRDNAQKLGEQVERIFGKMGIKMDDFKILFEGVGVAFGVIGGIIGNVVLNVGGFVLNMVEGIVDLFGGLIKFFQGDFKGGIKQAFGGLARIIVNPFDFASKTIVDVLNSLIDGFNKINPLTKIPNIPRPDIANSVNGFIDSFETGGFPQGVNAIVRTNEAGQEYIANARATNALATFFKEVGRDFGSSSMDNSDNRSYTQNNYGGTSSGGFTPAFSIR